MAKRTNYNRSAKRVNLDRLASAFAVALSLAALFVSLVEVSSERAQQRASVWPHIEIGESYSEDGFRIRLTNKGVGPALMGRIALTIDGRTVEDLDQLILETLGEADAFSYDRYSSSNPSNRVVAAGETLDLFRVKWDPQTRKLIGKWNNNVDLATCYCSISEDCWATSLQADQTVRVENCNTGVSL